LITFMPMARITAIWTASLCLAGCRADPPRTFTPPPPPAKLEHTVKAGDTLEAIATEAYGHGRYSLLIAQHNRITDVTRLQIGQRVATPAIAEMFRSAGLDPKFDQALAALASAVWDFHLALPSYTEARRGLERDGAPQINLPKIHAGRLGNIADVVEFAIRDIEQKVETPAGTPSKSIAQFQQALGHLRDLANGEVDGLYYDIDLVDQRLAHGLSNLYVWTIETHR
jgi:LysM repeat protein